MTIHLRLSKFPTNIMVERNSRVYTYYYYDATSMLSGEYFCLNYPPAEQIVAVFRISYYMSE